MERKALSGREYYALRELFGIINSFDQCADALQARCKQIPGGWRDLRMICAKARTLTENLMNTIPLQKLTNMQFDLANTRCEVKVVKDYTGKAKEAGFSYVPDKAIERMTERIINWECTCCDKLFSEGKRCPIYKDIEAIYPWAMDGHARKCPFAGLSSIMDAEDR